MQEFLLLVDMVDMIWSEILFIAFQKFEIYNNASGFQYREY